MMETVPNEILDQVASLLCSRDLLSLGLTCRRLGSVCFQVKTRHLCLLNTSSGLARFADFVQTAAPRTQDLTIYEAKWPSCSFIEWELHPLQTYDVHPHFPRDEATKLRTRKAFEAYRRFVSAERRRDPSTDLRRLGRVLALLPTLRTICVSGVRSWKRRENGQFSALRRAIWLSPQQHGSLNEMAEKVLFLVSHRPGIQTLRFRGRLDVDSLGQPGLRLYHLRLLDVESLNTASGAVGTFSEFFNKFPGLVSLKASFYRHGRPVAVPLEVVTCPELQAAELTNIVVKAESLVAFVDNHPKLRDLGLNNAELLGSTWASVLGWLSRREGLRVSRKDGWILPGSCS